MTERHRSDDELLEEALREFRQAPGAAAPAGVLVSLLQAQVAARGGARWRAPAWAAAAIAATALVAGFWAGRQSVDRRGEPQGHWTESPAEERAVVPASLPKPPRIPFVPA